LPHPLLYEINTRCWLRGLSERTGRPITLANVPDTEFARWRQLGFTHVWLMGVWTTGRRSRAIALKSEQLRALFTEILPGWRKEDVPGSPYAIGNYEVPPELGGAAGLKAFREKLNAHGLKLLLDFVSNHAGLDHPWVAERPELFVQSPGRSPGTFREKTVGGPRWLAHGKDPNFPPWSDTVQLDYRRLETRAAMIELLRSIAGQCDGIRCDMAMLLLNDVFVRNWERFPAPVPGPASEFWAEAISDVKNIYPDFLFLAEAYWGLEARLQALGFDYTYDKCIYDCLVEHRHAELQRHLLEAAPEYVAKSAHFLENHDERRVATVLSPARHRAAALLMLGLPGMRFLYEGQLEGWRIQTPVHLARWPGENPDTEISAMYENLLTVLKTSAVGHGKWKILPPKGWPDNPTAQHFFVIQWQGPRQDFDLVVVNFASHHSQCVVHPVIEGLAAHNWEMRDLLGAEIHQRQGGVLEKHGLHLDLPGNGARLFQFMAVKTA
jgi:glycosidase